MCAIDAKVVIVAVSNINRCRFKVKWKKCNCKQEASENHGKPKSILLLS